jgi:hypothetical protein
MAWGNCATGSPPSYDDIYVRLGEAVRVGGVNWVTVGCYGVTTKLGTIPYGSGIDLSDAQARAFFALEADVRAAVGAAAWSEPTPAPWRTNRETFVRR